MTEDNEQPNWFSPDDPRGELAKLVARRDLLVQALRETEDTAARADLAYQLRVASQQIEAISWASDGGRPAEEQHPPAAVTADLPPSDIPTGIGPNGVAPQHPADDDPLQGEPAPAGGPGDDRSRSGIDADQALSDPTFAETMAQALSQDLPPIHGDSASVNRESPPVNRESPPVNGEVAEEDLDWDQRATIEHSWSELPTADPDGAAHYAWPAHSTGSPDTANEVVDQRSDHPVDSQPWPDHDPMPGSPRLDDNPPMQATDPAYSVQKPVDHYPDHGLPDHSNVDQPYPEQPYGDKPYPEPSYPDHSNQERSYPDHSYPDPDPSYPDHPNQERSYPDHSYPDPDPSYPDQPYPDQPYPEVRSADGQPSDDIGQPQPLVDPPGSIGSTRWSNEQAGVGERTPDDRTAAESRRAPITDATAGPVARDGFVKPSGPVLAVVGVSLALLAVVLWVGGSRQSDDQANESIAPAAPQAAPLPDSEGETVLTNVQAVLRGLGLDGVSAEVRDGVLYLAGSVATQADLDSASTAVRTVADTYPIDTSALAVEGAEPTPAAAPAQVDERARSLQTELDRILAATPLIFGPGQAALTELHQRILNNAVIALQAYPEFTVTIAGFTDDQGDEAQNRQLSLSRAESVRGYLVGQGLPAASFLVEARGEETASGSTGLAGLERRVEFEVEGTAQPAGPQETIRVAIVAPSASNDLAFTQSMVDAVNTVADERPLELAVTDNTFVPDDAAAAVTSYAEQGFDLVIAHGSQFGSALIEIAPQYPETAFAWGTASDTFGQPNVYAYDAAAQEGGYVMGVMAGLLSESSVIGVVGPIEVGDAAQYVRGFEAGARAETPGTNVQVTYTGSFSDIGLASEAAQAHLGAGADVLTGSAQMVVGAIAAAEPSGALWFGTQADQSSLAPGIVVASQVYHWEVALRDILDDVQAGTLNGTTYTADLANGGLVIEYNPDYPLSPEVRQRADQLSAAIANGSVTPPS